MDALQEYFDREYPGHHGGEFVITTAHRSKAVIPIESWYRFGPAGQVLGQPEQPPGEGADRAR
jgi:hypothetical protein